MLQTEIYSQLDRLTKEELINIIIDNQLFISDDWVKKLSKKEINIPFEEFWKAYDYKKGSKKWAETAWKRLSNKDREDAMKAVPLYVAERDPDYICMATTWIHQKRREGILEDAQTKKEKPKQEQKQTELWLSPEDLKEFNSYILNQ